MGQVLDVSHVDFSPTDGQPRAARILIASVVSVVGSLSADALLVALGAAVFPSTKGYVHFQFHDYATLTIAGVAVACVAWPITTRITSEPRWMFFRMAILVTFILWLPDIYILAKGQPTEAVGVLMTMHVAIALVTYNSLVRIAKPREESVQ